jgi:hypothetical protein
LADVRVLNVYVGRGIDGENVVVDRGQQVGGSGEKPFGWTMPMKLTSLNSTNRKSVISNPGDL